MKTVSNLFGKVTDWDNFLLAADRAAEGRRFDKNVAAFNFRKESGILRLQRELQSKTYTPGPYTTFYVYDPKQRLISAAPFRDRVVHHALCNVIEPVFEQTFIHDSYANRVGKGTHRAIGRFQHFARRYKYVLKCDIRKFFPSIDHEILKREIRRKIACPDTLWLIDRIIDASNPQEPHVVWFPGDDLLTPAERRRGLPIGNLTSQFWANVYLNRFDHFVKETLGAPGYIRYVDDFVLFSDSPAQLAAWKAEIAAYLAGLRLLLHPRKCHIHRCERGVPFLGFRVWPRYRVVKKENMRRYRRFLAGKTRALLVGRLHPDTLESGLNSWLGHVGFGQCKRLIHHIFWALNGQGIPVFVHPRGSWRVLW